MELLLEKVVKNPIKTGIGAVLSIAAIVTISSSFFTVDAGERGAVIRLGSVDRVVSDGLHFKLPFVEDVKHFSIRIQRIDAQGEGGSKDLQTVHTTIALNYHLNPDSIDWIYGNLSKDYQATIIQPAIAEVFKATTAKYTNEELITKRESVKNEIESAIKVRLATKKIITDNISITNFKFSEQFNKSIENKVQAEQEALTAKNQLERIKIEAEQKIASAKAEAESLRLQNQAVTPLMIELRKLEVQRAMIDKWQGTGAIVPQTVLGSNTGVMLNTK